MLLKALIYIIHNHLSRKRQLSIIHWNEWNKANETNWPKSPHLLAAGSGIYIFVLLQLRKEASGARGIFTTSEGTMKPHFMDFTPCSSYPLHYSFSRAEQNLHLKEGTRRETASKFSGLLSKVWAESPRKVSGEETTEKWLLRQVNCFLKQLFLWVPIVCHGGIMNKSMSSKAKKYCREVRTVRTHVKTGLKGSPQAGGQNNWRLTPPTAFNTVRAGEQTVEGIPGWRKGKNEWISEWVDGVEGWQRFVWGWVIKCDGQRERWEALREAKDTYSQQNIVASPRN